MSLVWEIQPGYAVQLPFEAGGNPLMIDIGGFAGAEGSRSIITQMSIRRGENVQYLHSLQDLIFAYSFGERIGQIQIAGLSFTGMCDSFGLTGIEYVLRWYDSNRIGARGSTIRMLIGGAGGGGVFRGFLDGLSVDIVKPDLRLANFGLIFHSLPQRRRGR